MRVFEMEEKLASPPVDPNLQTEGVALRAAARIANMLSIPLEFVDVKIANTPTGLSIAGTSIWVPKEITENLGLG